MDATLLARVGLSRLRLPIPTAKLSVVHSAAESLRDKEQGHIIWDALIQWVSELELESEVIEALCIPVLAKDAEVVDVAALQRAIARPSPLSDLYLGEIAGSPLRLVSWAKSNSGEAPTFFSADGILKELTKGRIVPQIFANRLELLEKNSGYPLLKQWAYEFSRLMDTYGEQSDGEMHDFVAGEYERAAGQHVTRRGHLARSAYLRTLSLASDRWGLPDRATYEESMYSTPVDFTFLRMLPGKPPDWIVVIEEQTPVSQAEWQKLVEDIVQKAAENEASPELLHMNLPFSSTKTFQAEVELVSCLHEGDWPQTEEVFRFHNFLPGKVELPRTPNWDIRVEPMPPDMSVTPSDSVRLTPALMPSVCRHVGYFHDGLLQRIAYLPANHCYSEDLLARPRLGGMDILLGDRHIGEISHWNWRWSPTHDKALKPHCGVSLSVSSGYHKDLLSLPRMKLSRHWRAKVLTRDQEYGSWEEKTLTGTLQ